MKSVIKTVIDSDKPKTFTFYGVNRTIDWSKALIQSTKITQKRFLLKQKVRYSYYANVEEQGE